MSFRTERAMARAPGLILKNMDQDGMMTDEEGDYVPEDQVRRDPLRSRGEQDLNTQRRSVFDPPDGGQETNDQIPPREHPLSKEEELQALIASQEEDMRHSWSLVNK